jgi:hypothetical protein
MHPQGVNQDYLAGRGQIGELMRSIDWSTTPIGAVETWSPALRTMVRMLLVNRFQLFIWWGPRHVRIYTDASRPILGAEHPKSMGQTAAECWSEINRYGYAEETHFTSVYRPMPDETVPSGIGGVLATVHEITGKVVGERRVVVLRGLGAHAPEAKTADAACATAVKTLTAHDEYIPFASIDLLDGDGRLATLAAASGVAEGETISPRVVSLDGGDGAAWPLAPVFEKGTPREVPALEARFGAVPPGPWSDRPSMAVVLPICSGPVPSTLKRRRRDRETRASLAPPSRFSYRFLRRHRVVPRRWFSVIPLVEPPARQRSRIRLAVRLRKRTA